MSAPASDLARFRDAYSAQRAAEGRGAVDPRSLPYVPDGPFATAWRVRSRTWAQFLAVTVAGRSAEVGRPLRVLDIGAGSGWLCHRLALMGHDAMAVDLRDDGVDGLGAIAVRAGDVPFQRVAASFQDLPLRPRTFDIAVFNASIPYPTSLERALAQAAAVVVSGGRIAILDSPFYNLDVAGAAMVAEKHAQALDRFGERAHDLLSLPFIEYLTAARLDAASAESGIEWVRHRVRYPLRYELRPLIAALTGRRAPSRFDLWEASVR
jgi:SAM-dependent methyltransferase